MDLEKWVEYLIQNLDLHDKIPGSLDFGGCLSSEEPTCPAEWNGKFQGSGSVDPELGTLRNAAAEQSLVETFDSEVVIQFVGMTWIAPS